MGNELASWERPHYAEGGGVPFLLYYVFGRFDGGLELSRERYRVSGVPAGIQILQVDPGQVLEGPMAELLEAEGDLAAAVRAAPHCLMLVGGVEDAATLDYLRDVIGIITCALDAGGVAVLDAFQLRWWSKSSWRETLFDAPALRPLDHVALLSSEEEGGLWLHTRGMRKFGRPDLSVRRVPEALVEPIVDLLTRFVSFMAQGALIPEGQEIKMKTLPSGMTCHHGGDLEDDDFNNVHVEIRWP
jgi:hypothetical protein